MFKTFQRRKSCAVRFVVPRSSARVTPTLKTFGRNIRTGFLGLLKWLEIAPKGLVGPHEL